MRVDLVLAGVGGQGTILASRALGNAAVGEGLEVRTSETIGMAQREGCVESQVRIGRGLLGARIPTGRADVLLGFELAEAARSLEKLKPGGLALVNRGTIMPVTVNLGLSAYDVDSIRRYIAGSDVRPFFLDATSLAERVGGPKMTNAVMLGALAGLGILPFGSGTLLEALLDLVPERAREGNRKAFSLGHEELRHIEGVM